MKLKDDKFISEYERPLLSLALQDISVLVDLQQRVTSEYFLYEPHQIIYIALSTLASKASIKKIDLESLIIECEKLGLKALGVEPTYLMLLQQGASDKANFEFYLEQVIEAYRKYKLCVILEDNFKATRDSIGTKKEISSDNLITKVNEDVSKIVAFEAFDREAVLFGDRIDDFIRERSEDPKDVRGLRTGFREFDKLINGLLPGTLTIIAGIAKAGKSTVLLNIANYVAIEAGIRTKDHPDIYPTQPILLISTEMYTDEDLSRTLAIRTLLPERQISNGIIFNDPKSKSAIQKATQEIKKAQILHIYMPDFSAQKVCNTIYHYKMKYNIGLAIFDYIKLSTSDDEIRNKREDQVLGDTTTALKSSAGKLHIPVLSACQVNTRSGLVADSDRIARYCNTLVHFRQRNLKEREKHNIHDHGTHLLEILYARGGGSNKSVPLYFYKSCCKLYEAEPFPMDDDDAEEEDTNGFTTPTDYNSKRKEKLHLENINDIMTMKDAHDLNVGESVVPDEGDIEF